MPLNAVHQCFSGVFILSPAMPHLKLGESIPPDTAHVSLLPSQLTRFMRVCLLTGSHPHQGRERVITYMEVKCRL